MPSAFMRRQASMMACLFASSSAVIDILIFLDFFAMGVC
jgi:hypothetical protein